MAKVTTVQSSPYVLVPIADNGDDGDDGDDDGDDDDDDDAAMTTTFVRKFFKK